MTYSKSICAFVLIFSLVNAAKLPNFIRPCRQTDPNLNQCVVERAREVIPKLMHGVPELDFPPLLPFFQPSVSLNEDGLSMKLVNISIEGFETAEFLDADFDLKKRHIQAKLHFPRITLNATYIIDGKISIFPIKGDGGTYIKFDGVSVVFDADYDLIESNAKEYARIEDKQAKVNYDLENATFKFGNLFEGDEKLGDEMNAVINQNWASLHETFKPTLKLIISEIVVSLVKRFTESIPFNEILLP